MRKSFGSLGFVLVVLLTGCSSGIIPSTVVAPSVQGLRGVVHGGQPAVTGGTIKLWAAGSTGDGSTGALLTSTTSDSSGNFTLGTYTCPGSDPFVYLTATGGNPGMIAGTNNTAISMLAALTDCNSLKANAATTFVFVDEVTTMGAVAALYPYMTSTGSLGSGSADAATFATAFGTVADYTNTSTGSTPGPSLPAGFYASSTEINTLGNIIASCINTAGGIAGDLSPCGNLFNLTKVGGIAPTNTLGAMLNIINNPAQNASGLFALASSVTPFQPVDSVAPTSWALSILPIAATPTFSIAGGSYSSAQFVGLSSVTPGVVIHYTTDGSTPTAASQIYNGSSGTITVSSSETIKAIALESGYASSVIASAAYAISGSSATYNVGGQVALVNSCGNSAPPIKVVLNQGSTLIQTTTTANGNFLFTGVPNGTYTVTPSISGPSSVFYPTAQSVSVGNNNVTNANFNANLGYTVSGTVSYGGSQTGQIYLSLNSTNCGGGGMLGTSISSKGAYTIHGVPPGSYTIQAWMDPLGQGTQNAIDPVIDTSGNNSVTVTASNVTNAAVNIIDPTFATPTSNPTLQNIYPNPLGALILFQPSQNSSGLEDANQYVVEWSTSATLGGGSGGAQFASIAGSHTFTASGDKGLWVLTNASLTSGQTYFFQARSINTLNGNSHPSGWCNYTSSGCSGTSGFTGVTIAAPPCSGCTAVSGSVIIPAGITIKPGAPLYLGLLQFSSGTGNGDPIGFYVTEIASPSNGANNFTVAAPSGSNYAVFGLLDQNNNGGFGPGSISNLQNKVQANLTIGGSTQTVASVTLPTANSTATVSTQFSSSSCLTSCSPSTSDQLTFTVNGSDKLPVAVTLNSGPNVPSNSGTVALDMGICTTCGSGQFEYSVSLPGTPNVGDTYGFTVTYSDGSQDTGTTVASAVTGWNGGSTVTGASDAPTALAPNNISAGTTPTFTWTDSSNSMGANFYYRFNLYNFSTCSGNCQIWQVPGNNSKSNGFSNSITSIPWITSGNDVTGASNNLPSVTALTPGTVYSWQVQVQDSNGNSASTQVQYQP